MVMICTTGTSIARDIAWKGDGSAYREAIRARVAGLVGKPGFAAQRPATGSAGRSSTS